MGTNPHGSQIFALDLDGSNLEQLTNARGLIADTDGFTTIELTGPQAYAQSD